MDDLPEMQAAVVQQGQEAALVEERKPRLGWPGLGRAVGGLPTGAGEGGGSPGQAGSASG